MENFGKAIKLTTAIGSIVFGLFITILAFVYLDRLNSMEKTAFIFTASYFLILLICIAVTVIILGIIFCLNKRHFGVGITLLVLCSAMFMFIIIGIICYSSKSFREFVFYCEVWDILAVLFSLLLLGGTIIYIVFVRKQPEPDKSHLIPVNDTKGLRITSAVLSIVVGALLTISMIVLIDKVIEAEYSVNHNGYYYDGNREYSPFEIQGALGFLRTICFFLMVVGIIMIVFGGMFCNKKRAKNNAIVILVIIALFLFLESLGILIGASNPEYSYQVTLGDVIAIAACAIIVVFNSIYLARCGKRPADENAVMGNVKITVQGEKKNEHLLDEIAAVKAKKELLEQLKNEGVLSDEEYKSAVLKELDKI